MQIRTPVRTPHFVMSFISFRVHQCVNRVTMKKTKKDCLQSDLIYIRFHRNEEVMSCRENRVSYFAIYRWKIAWITIKSALRWKWDSDRKEHERYPKHCHRNTCSNSVWIFCCLITKATTIIIIIYFGWKQKHPIQKKRMQESNKESHRPYQFVTVLKLLLSVYSIHI